MTREVTWRCEACGGKLTARGLHTIAEADRIHLATCPGVIDEAAIYEAEWRIANVDVKDDLL